MSRDSLQAVRAVFLAAIMVTSVFAAGVAFSGSAAADVTSIDAISAEDTTAGDIDQIENVTLVGVDRTGSNLSDIDVTIEGAPSLSVVNATVSSAENFDLSNVSADTRSNGGFFVEIDGDNTPNGNITIEATLDTTNVDPGTTATYDATSADGASVSGDFQIQSDDDGSQSDGVLTVDPDGGTDAHDTIQAAVNNADSGDIVEVTSDTYDEQVVIDRDDASDLTIRAVDGASPTIRHSAEGGEPAVAIDQDDVTIEGLEIVRDNSSDLVAQAVRVAGNNAELTDNTYQLGVGANSAAVAVLTDSSGAAGGPDVSGVTISDITISGGEIITKDASQSGVLVADDGAASFGGAGSVSVSDVTFTANADSTQVLELDTDGGVINIADTLNNNEFDRAAAASETATDASINGFSIEGIISTSIQDAVDRADSGSTVAVASGTYEESVTIDTEGVTLESAESVEPTVIGQSSVAISVESPGVTVSDLTIRNPEGDRGVRATDNATNVKIVRNTIEDVGTAGAFTQSRGILVSSLKNGDSASGLEVRNNTVNTIQGTGGNSEQTIGIQILEESNGGGLIENVVVDGNVVTNLLDNRSSQGINFNGNIEGEITNNNISTLNTDRPGEDLGFTQAIALNAGGNAADAPQNVRISGNTISGLDDRTPSTESFRATHIILSSVDDTDSIDIRNNVFIAAASDENYILDRASGDFDLQRALDVNTFEPSVVQVEEDSDRILVPDTGADVDVVNVDQQTGFSEIQPAVDNANRGDTIRVGPGTFNESVTIGTEGVTLKAASGASPTLTSTGSKTVTLQGTDITIADLTITNSGGGNGIDIPSKQNASGLRLDGVTIANTSIAFFNDLDGNTEPDFTDVVFTDVTIENSERKGIYTEALSDAIFDEVIVDDVGSDNYGFNTGIDINLKYDDYQNVTIQNSVVANVSEGDPFNGNPSFSSAVGIKARDDDGGPPPGYNANPATLDDVTIDNVSIKDSFNGLRIGEPGVDYSSAPQGPTDVTITDSTFQNNSGYHVADVTGNLILNNILNNQNNDFDRVVTIEDDAGNITGSSIFGAIQPAVDEAPPSDIVNASSGIYNESVEISTPNVTVSGQHDLFNGIEGTVIEGRVSLTAPETEIRETKIAPPTFADDPDGGNAINVTANSSVIAVNVTASAAVVDESTINITSVASDGELRIAAVAVVEGGSETRDVTISDNHVRAEGRSESDGSVVANGVVDAGDTEKTLIVNNGIRVASENTSAAVVSQSLDDRFGSNGAPTSEILLNEITATSEEGNGVGYSFVNASGIAAGTAAEEQLIKYNVFRDVDTINHEGTAGTLDLTVNRWRTDLDGVEFRTDPSDDPQFKGGEIVFDPVLTEEKSVEQLNNDELLRENENGELVATTRDYGSYIEIESDGEPAVIGFPAPPEEPIAELFSNNTLNREDGEGISFFIYDNDAQRFRPVFDPANTTPDAGEVLVITTEGQSGISDEIVVPVNTTIQGKTANPNSGTVDLNEGWNLVATGAANSPSGPTIVGGDLGAAGQFQIQPRQPGAPPATVSAYDGTWVFVDGGQLFTGYVEDQPPAIYLDTVLAPDTEDDQNDT